MRRNTIHRFWGRLSVVLVLILTCGCTDEEIMKGTPRVEEGVPVQVSIPFNVKRSSVWTRAAQSETDEQRINILYVIAFNEDGSVSGRAVYYDQNNATGKGQIEKFPMSSGKNKKIFIVANPQSGVGTLVIRDLDAVKNLSEFQRLNTRLLEPMNVERNYLMMLGQMKNADGSEGITVNADGEMLNTNQTPVMLERLDAHIRFVIKVDNSEHSDIKFTPRYYAVENIPQGSYLVPRAVGGEAAADKKSSLDQNGDGSYYDYTEEMEANEKGSGYKSMSVGNSTTKYFDEGYLEIGDEKCPYFEFYLLENRRQYKKKITAAEKQKSKAHGIEDAAHLYALRAKREKNKMDKEDPNKPGKTEENGDLIFANDHSTCVRIYGTLEYTDYDKLDKMMKFYTANVTYTVFLGATGNKTEDGEMWYDIENLVNDYNTVRNGFYTYTVTLSGVNSMRVEVEVETDNTPKEERPDVEGDVIVAGGEVHSMDAHYGRTLIRLSKKDIQKGLAWAVSTPLCSGMKNIDSDLLKPENEEGLENNDKLKTNLQLNDYKWVLFAINKEYPSVDHSDGERHDNYVKVPHDSHYCRNVLVKFPGYQYYNGGEANGSTQAPALGGDGSRSSYYNAKVKLYDVNQLLNRLCLEAQKADSDIFDNFDKTVTDGSKDSVTISVFVDEFVYYYDPTKNYYKSPLDDVNTSDLLLWKRAVNGENRYLHICKAGAKYSPDGNTSWANSVVSISQRPIYTFYNENNTELQSAWGTESIIEAGDAEYPDGELWVYDNEQPVGDGNTGNKYQMYGGENLSTYDNGRLNNIRVLFGRDENRSGQELRWSVLRSIYTDVGALRKGYRDIWHACLMRNRDLNGDDIVQENEIRWYLASIDQLTDLWIGQYSVPNAKLYDDARFATASKVRRYHIASSTFYDNEAYRPSVGLHTYENPYCVWGEEGASIGGWYVKYSWGESGSHKNTEVQKKNASAPQKNTGHISYRCVRNLGIPLERRDEVPDDYVSYENTGKRNEQYGYMEPYIYTRFIDGQAYYECRLDVSRLDANSRRAPLGEGGFLLGTSERNFNNRPYNGLALLIQASNNPDGIYDAKNWQDAFKNETTKYPCPRGYRIPNQRELMLLYTRWRGYFRLKNGTPFMCKTSYGYNGISPYNNSKRYGFAYDGTNMYLIDGDRTFAVRAVRDWTPGTDD